MNQIIPCAGLALIVALAGCGDSKVTLRERRIASKSVESMVADLRTEVDNALNEAESIESAVAELRAQVDSLRSEIEGFSGGSDWRDIVPEVETQSERVESALADLELSIEKKIEAVDSELSDLEYKVR